MDFILCYKIAFDYISVNFGDFFRFSTVSTTRGHKYKLYRPQRAKIVRQTFFVKRVINVWNSLPTSLSVDFSSLATSKNSIRSVDFSSLCGIVFNITRCHCWFYYSLSSVCLFISFIDTSIFQYFVFVNSVHVEGSCQRSREPSCPAHCLDTVVTL